MEIGNHVAKAIRSIDIVLLYEWESLRRHQDNKGRQLRCVVIMPKGRGKSENFGSGVQAAQGFG